MELQKIILNNLINNDNYSIIKNKILFLKNKHTTDNDISLYNLNDIEDISVCILYSILYNKNLYFFEKKGNFTIKKDFLKYNEEYSDQNIEQTDINITPVCNFFVTHSYSVNIYDIQQFSMNYDYYKYKNINTSFSNNLYYFFFIPNYIINNCIFCNIDYNIDCNNILHVTDKYNDNYNDKYNEKNLIYIINKNTITFLKNSYNIFFSENLKIFLMNNVVKDENNILYGTLFKYTTIKDNNLILNDKIFKLPDTYTYDIENKQLSIFPIKSENLTVQKNLFYNEKLIYIDINHIIFQKCKLLYLYIIQNTNFLNFNNCSLYDNQDNILKEDKKESLFTIFYNHDKIIIKFKYLYVSQETYILNIIYNYFNQNKNLINTDNNDNSYKLLNLYTIKILFSFLIYVLIYYIKLIFTTKKILIQKLNKISFKFNENEVEKVQNYFNKNNLNISSDFLILILLSIQSNIKEDYCLICDNLNYNSQVFLFNTKENDIISKKNTYTIYQNSYFIQKLLNNLIYKKNNHNIYLSLLYYTDSDNFKIINTISKKNNLYDIQINCIVTNSTIQIDCITSSNFISVVKDTVNKLFTII